MGFEMIGSFEDVSFSERGSEIAIIGRRSSITLSVLKKIALITQVVSDADRESTLKQCIERLDALAQETDKSWDQLPSSYS